MRLCNSRIPEEHLVCYQTSQRNWVIIKMLYRCLRWCLLSWHRSRLWFVTPSIREVSLGPLGNTHHISLASIATNELVVRWCITERVKRLAGNEIELGIKIPTIESRASNIPMTKGIVYRIAWILDIVVHPMRSSWNMWEPTWVSRSRCWLSAREVSRSCLHDSRTRRVYTLKVRWR